MRPACSLIIPNFNGAELLRSNLPSVLAAASAFAGGCEVIVIDDASADASLAVLAEFPMVRVTRHETNQGFADAVHTGVAAASADLLIFLNSDVRPEADFIAPLLAHFDDPAVFSVGPLVLHEDGRRNDLSWRCYTVRRGRFRAVPWRPEAIRLDRPMLSLFSSGGSIALRKSQFQKLGGFAPIFKPFYSEDFDLGIRAWRHGWKTLFEPASRVVHSSEKGAIKTHCRAAQVKRVRVRNRFLLEWIHLPGRWLVSMLPGYIRQVLGRSLRGDTDYLAGLIDALRRLAEARRLRAEVESQSVIGLEAVLEQIRRDFGSDDVRFN